MCLYKDLIIGGFATGHIRVFSASTGALLIEACAHARWISAMDMSLESGLVMICFIARVVPENVDTTPPPHSWEGLEIPGGWGGGSI